MFLLQIKPSFTRSVIVFSVIVFTDKETEKLKTRNVIALELLFIVSALTVDLQVHNERFEQFVSSAINKVVKCSYFHCKAQQLAHDCHD